MTWPATWTFQIGETRTNTSCTSLYSMGSRGIKLVPRGNQMAQANLRCARLAARHIDQHAAGETGIAHARETVFGAADSTGACFRGIARLPRHRSCFIAHHACAGVAEVER